ncbi:hypothetical protein Rhopal_004484-T1 [Rhodotorula paludigena]|uniref:Sec39 domain-containing protein n=1 Tax=Rhodotorula paludigena TaxID=86838 RepID=A0AAV5GG35_9BASI|nr:hypothetical protein Rhopal_004484-T1 [Rhodotorula paludigena]
MRRSTTSERTRGRRESALSPRPATLDDLRALVDAGEHRAAFALARALDPPPPRALVAFVAQLHFAHADPNSLAPADLDALFAAFPPSEHLWNAAAAVRAATAAHSVPLANKAVEWGLRAADRWVASLADLAHAVESEDWSRVEGIVRDDDADERKAVLARRALLELQDRILSWEALYGEGQGAGDDSASAKGDGEDEGGADKREDEGEDGWGDLDLPSEDGALQERSPQREDGLKSPLTDAAAADTAARPSLSTFLTRPLAHTALSLAASAALPELTLLCTLHPAALWPERVALLDAVPEYVDPAEYVDLLPAVDSATGATERDWDDLQPWRPVHDWSEQLPSLPTVPAAAEGPSAHRSADDLRAWYLARVERLADVGLVANALALVQHAASKGVLGLDSLGEELSLLSKLVYDRPAGAAEPAPPLTLEYWRVLSPKDVVRAYTATSAPDELAHSIRALVLPYLGVLESRLERAGTPDADLATRMLHEYLLELPLDESGGAGRGTGLERLLAVFEASKPTLPAGQRIVKSDTDLARLALAALYGCGKAGAHADAAVTMGKIFECLPAFDTSAPDPPDAQDADLFALASAPASTTRASASSISTLLPPAPPPSSLLSALSRASPRALSAHLDALDLHLSQLESFLRYSSAPPSGLAWFLAAYRSTPLQRQWATRVARTAASAGGGREGDEGAFESEDEWVGLMDFLAEATGVAGEAAEGDGSDEEERAEKTGLGRAFWRLGKDEAMRIFFGGLLGAGRFSLARSLFEPSSMQAPLEPHVVEELVIAASRDFYDNSESGNLHSGEMKLAFECLSAAPQQTPAIRRERDFIEATSRLCSFRLDSRPGIPLTPIELRHAPNRLVYVSRLLSTNDTAFQHPEMVLELVRKLGYPAGGAAEVRTLAMLSDAARNAGAWERSAELCDRAVRAVDALRKGVARGKVAQDEADRAADDAWKACFALGKHPGWSDPHRRLEAIGQALTLCPPERIQDLLPVWTQLEREAAQDAARKAREGSAGPAQAGMSPLSGDAARAAASAAAEAAAAGAAKVGNFLAAAAAKSAGATARNLTPSPLPLGSHKGSDASADSPASTMPRTPQSPTHNLAHETAAAASHTLRRAAAFFGGVGGGPQSSMRPASASPSRSNRPVTPTSPPSVNGTVGSPGRPRATASSPAPPPRSPSPPSRFAAALSGLSDDRPSSSLSTHSSNSNAPPQQGGGGGFGSGFGFGAGLSNRFTQGVGWLIGADEMLEQERAFEEEQRRRREQAASVREVDKAPEPPAARKQDEMKAGPEPAKDDDEDDWASSLKLAPYAASYRPPADVQRHAGPVSLLLELGVEHEVEESMEVEYVDPADVLAAVRSLRDDDGGIAEMQLDLPWELEGGGVISGRAIIVVGERRLN